MLLFDLPPEIFGGDAHKDGHTVVGGEEVVKGVGIAKYLDERSLGIFAGSCRTARKFAKSMQNDLPRMLMLYLVRLSPQMRALMTKSSCLMDSTRPRMIRANPAHPMPDRMTTMRR